MSKHQELFFGLVGATGTDLDLIRIFIQNELRPLGITLHKLHLSEILLDREKKTYSKKLQRIEECMNLGDQIREKEALSSVALLGIQEIRKFREKHHKKAHDESGVKLPEEPKTEPCPNYAYIFHSLKHPKEVEKLRELYGENFYLISVYSELEKRKEKILRDANSSDKDLDPKAASEVIDELLKRDLAASDSYGQQVQKVFPLADLFLNGDDENECKTEVARFVKLIFGDVRTTPTKAEFFMFQAFATAVRSGDLGRQVGACVATAHGELISVGCNDVPKAGGGPYWPPDENDGRDIVSGKDVNEIRQKELLKDLLDKLGGRLNLGELTTAEFVEKAFSKGDLEEAECLKGAEIFNVIGYYRAVHAETAALLEAARVGVSVKNCILYVTTFPCHECARHLVYAGIEEVVYVEPYPKSLASKHYPDSIELVSTDKTKSNEEQKNPKKVIFRPFTGIAPSKYFGLFSVNKGDRKNLDGTVKEWNAVTAVHRYDGPPIGYTLLESNNLEKQKELVDEISEELKT